MGGAIMEEEDGLDATLTEQKVPGGVRPGSGEVRPGLTDARQGTPGVSPVVRGTVGKDSKATTDHAAAALPYEPENMVRSAGSL